MHEIKEKNGYKAEQEEVGRRVREGMEGRNEEDNKNQRIELERVRK